jgi:hypothetical protein
MNYDIWFLFEQFRSLSVGGKIAVVCGHILVLLLAMLWATFLARRRSVRTSSAHTEFIGHPTENPNERADNPQENENLEKPKQGHIIGSDLLSNPSDNRGDWYLHYQTGDETPKDKQRIPKSCHIATIVNKLRRRVTHSGTEPYSNNLMHSILNSGTYLL